MKKLLSIVLSLMLLLSGLAMPAMAEEETVAATEEALLSEEEQNSLREEFKLLEVLGLTYDFSKAHTEMSRVELAVLVSSLGGFPQTDSGEAVYSDVPRRHWGFAAVNTAIINGCMTGKTEYLFEPELTATVVDGLRVMLGLLGYSTIAEELDWDDSHCVDQARRAGLLKGISLDMTGNLTPYIMAKLFVNALELPVVKFYSMADGNALYQTDGDTRYITQRFGCYFKKGTVNGVENFALAGYQAPGRGRILIDTRSYSTGGHDWIDYAGESVKYIADGDEDNARVIYMMVVDNEDTLVVNAEDIILYENYQLSYLVNEKSKTINVARNCKILLNGAEISRYDERDFMPLAGGLRLKDINGDGAYDLVFITYILYYRVAGANEEGYLNDGFTGLQTQLEGNEITCVDGGRVVDFDSVTNGAVIAVMPNAITYTADSFPMTDNSAVTKVKLDVTARSVEGQVNLCSADSCVLGEVEYSYSAYFQKLAELYIGYPKLSSTTTLYLDDAGKIVAMKTASQFTSPGSGIRYGYLLDVGKTPGLDAKYAFKMIVDTATEQVMECADTFYMNDVRNPSTLNNIVGLYVNGEVVPQLVAYRLDAEGKISRLYMAVDRVNATIIGLNGEEMTNLDCGDETYPGYDAEKFALNYTASSTEYRASFAHRYIIADDAVVFVVPENRTNTKLYKVTNGNYFTVGGRYPVAIYDVDDNYYIHSMVVDSKQGSTGRVAYSLWDGAVSYMVSGKVKTIIDEEPREAIETKSSLVSSLTFSAYTEASLVPESETLKDTDTYYSRYNGTAWTDLMPGDVIQIAKNEMGEVIGFRTVFRYQDLYKTDGSVNCQELGTSQVDASIYNTVGIVQKILGDGSVIYNVDPEGKSNGIRLAREKGMERAYSRGKVRVFIYNSDKGKVTTGALSDVQIGDVVMVRSELGAACEMFVYR